jgi:CRP/FNR family transcriptional regulator
LYVRSIDHCARCSLHRVCFAPGALQQSCAVKRLPVHPGQLSPGEVLYVAGQGCSALYALRSGCIKDVVTRRNGAERVVQFCFPGEVAGLGGLASARACSTAIALTATRYCRISWASFRQLAAEVPETGHELVRLLAATVTAAHELVVSLLEQDALARVAGLLLDISARLRRGGLDGLHFRLSVSRGDIASYLGLTIETVSRCFSELDRRRLIAVRGRDLRFLRPSGLQLLAGEA